MHTFFLSSALLVAANVLDTVSALDTTFLGGSIAVIPSTSQDQNKKLEPSMLHEFVDLEKFSNMLPSALSFKLRDAEEKCTPIVLPHKDLEADFFETLDDVVQGQDLESVITEFDFSKGPFLDTFREKCSASNGSTFLFSVKISETCAANLDVDADGTAEVAVNHNIRYRNFPMCLENCSIEDVEDDVGAAFGSGCDVTLEGSSAKEECTTIDVYQDAEDLETKLIDTLTEAILELDVDSTNKELDFSKGPFLDAFREKCSASNGSMFLFSVKPSEYCSVNFDLLVDNIILYRNIPWCFETCSIEGVENSVDAVFGSGCDVTIEGSSAEEECEPIFFSQDTEDLLDLKLVETLNNTLKDVDLESTNIELDFSKGPFLDTYREKCIANNGSIFIFSVNSSETCSVDFNIDYDAFSGIQVGDNVSYKNVPVCGKNCSVENVEHDVGESFGSGCNLIFEDSASNQEPESQEPESQEPAPQEPESQEPESKEPESQEPESKEPAPQEPESKEPAPQEPGSGGNFLAVSSVSIASFIVSVTTMLMI